VFLIMGVPLPPGVKMATTALGVETNEVSHHPKERGTSAVGSRFQATASEYCNRLRRPNVSHSDLGSVVTSCIRVQ
jgi:hypothetical protein